MCDVMGQCLKEPSKGVHVMHGKDEDILQESAPDPLLNKRLDGEWEMDRRVQKGGLQIGCQVGAAFAFHRDLGVHLLLCKRPADTKH